MGGGLGVAEKTEKGGFTESCETGAGGRAKDEITLLRREHEMVNKVRTWTRVGGALLFV